MKLEDLTIKYNEQGLLPAIIQDDNNGTVLMLAYMSEESLKKTLETGLTHFWSRSRQEIWQKGETSGHIQEVQSISFDCDNDTLLVKVKQKGFPCHTGRKTCFYKRLNLQDLSIQESDELSSFHPVKNDEATILQEVYEVLVNRKINPKENSYTSYLFEAGLDKILKKIGEEAAEVIIASKNPCEEEIIYEVADLIYHLLVNLVENDIPLEKIYSELRSRR